jgi:hypothetical protein
MEIVLLLKEEVLVIEIHQVTVDNLVDNLEILAQEEVIVVLAEVLQVNDLAILTEVILVTKDKVAVAVDLVQVLEAATDPIVDLVQQAHLEVIVVLEEIIQHNVLAIEVAQLDSKMVQQEENLVENLENRLVDLKVPLTMEIINREKNELEISN